MSRLNYYDWGVGVRSYKPEDRQFYESIFSLGNGYIGVRGFSPEDPEALPHERSTYLCGVYDYIKPGITDMVNTPDFFCTRFTFDGSPFLPRQGKLGEYGERLSFRDGTLEQTMVWEAENGSKTRIHSVRFLSMQDVGAACIHYELTPLNYSGSIELLSGVDARITNLPISDDQLKSNTEVLRLLKYGQTTAGYRSVCLSVMTREKRHRIAEAAVFGLSGNIEPVLEQDVMLKGYVGKKVEFHAEQGLTYSVDKFIGVAHKEDGGKELSDEAMHSANQAAALGYSGLRGRNRAAWNEIWKRSDIEISGDSALQSAVRYNIFQLIQTNASENDRVGIGARGILHGRYKGCYFWDTEIFMLPFYLYTNPAAARNLLKFRYHTLDAARKNAREMGLPGAKFPWMCSTEGREQCESWDTGCCEIHINADVPYAIDRYIKVTGDTAFLRDYGLEIYIETARYWAQRFSYDEEKDCYNLLFVKGPDEYCGVTSNNTYTVFMALHNFRLAMEGIRSVAQTEPELWQRLAGRLGFDAGETERWQDILQKARLNYDPQRNLYIEDDTFLRLEPVSPERMKTSAAPLYHLVSYDRLQRMRVLKQADLVLLMLLLPEEFTPEQKRNVWDYYEPITLHDSTLSFGTHGQLAARLGLKAKAMDYLRKSAFLDLEDIMQNTGPEGLHFAAFGATWQAVVFGFAGFHVKDGLPAAEPLLTPELPHIAFSAALSGKTYRIEAEEADVRIKNLSD